MRRGARAKGREGTHTATRVRRRARMASNVSAFFREKYERDARKNWDIFYKHHGENFFRDRHWLAREWPEHFASADASSSAPDLSSERKDYRRGPAPASANEGADGSRTFLEIGCGVGNTVFPLLELDPRATVYCCDFSARAVELVRKRAMTLTNERDRSRVKAFVCDVTCESLAEHVPAKSVDVATLIFALSAMSKPKMEYALRNLSTVMRAEQRGTICVRDYAAGDLAQERFDGKDAQKLSENFYVRSDGTRAYYFTADDLTELFAAQDMEMREMFVHERTITNRAQDVDMNRRWIQASFASARLGADEFEPPPPDAQRAPPWASTARRRDAEEH